MKKLLTTLAAFTALTAAASAADLPRRMAPPPVFTPVPVFTWTGFYAGFNAGYGFGTGDERDTTVTYGQATNAVILPNFGSPSVDGTSTFSNNRSGGFAGGGQIGYNLQVTPGSGFVVGVEADAQYVDFGRGRGRISAPVGSIGGVPTADVLPNPVGVAAFAPDFTPVNAGALSNLAFFGTVRGRIGYAFDRVLFYGTGGFAYGMSDTDRRYAGRNGDDFRTGYAVGGGVEYALPTDSFLNFFKSSAVTLKAEAVYVNLDHDNNRSNAVVGVYDSGALLLANDPNVRVRGGRFRSEDEFVVVRGGLNYKFGTY